MNVFVQLWQQNLRLQINIFFVCLSTLKDHNEHAPHIYIPLKLQQFVIVVAAPFAFVIWFLHCLYVDSRCLVDSSTDNTHGTSVAYMDKIMGWKFLCKNFGFFYLWFRVQFLMLSPTFEQMMTSPYLHLLECQQVIGIHFEVNALKHTRLWWNL